MKSIQVSILLVSLSYLSTAMADHPVSGLQSGTSGPIITSSGKTAKKGTGAVGINFQHVEFDNFSNERLSELTDQDEDVHGTSSLQRTSIDAVIGVTNNLTLGFSVPFVKRNNLKETAHHGSDEEFELLGSAEGLGDAQIFGQYQFYANSNNSTFISALFGVKLPTGETNEKSREGERLEVELQPGTGSTDPFLGLAISTSLGLWELDSNILYTLATQGSQDTDLGDIFNYNVALSAPLSSLFNDRDDHSSHGHNSHMTDKLNLVLEMNGEWRDRIEIDNETEQNSGGNVVYLSPGVSLTTDGWVASALAGWPVIDDLHGEQSDPEFRFVFKLTKLIGQ